MKTRLTGRHKKKKKKRPHTLTTLANLKGVNSTLQEGTSTHLLYTLCTHTVHIHVQTLRHTYAYSQSLATYLRFFSLLHTHAPLCTVHFQEEFICIRPAITALFNTSQSTLTHPSCKKHWLAASQFPKTRMILKVNVSVKGNGIPISLHVFEVGENP